MPRLMIKRKSTGETRGLYSRFGSRWELFEFERMATGSSRFQLRMSQEEAFRLLESAPAEYEVWVIADRDNTVIRPPKKVAKIEDPTPTSFELVDAKGPTGIWKQTPVIERTSGGYAVPFALMVNGQPVSGKFMKATVRDLLELLADQTHPTAAAFVKTLPDGQPVVKPAAPALKEPSAEELANVEPVTDDEYYVPAAVLKDMMLADPIFNARVHARWNQEAAAKAAFERKAQKEREEAARTAAKRRLEQRNE